MAEMQLLGSGSVMTQAFVRSSDDPCSITRRSTSASSSSRSTESLRAAQSLPRSSLKLRSRGCAAPHSVSASADEVLTRRSGHYLPLHLRRSLNSPAALRSVEVSCDASRSSPASQSDPATVHLPEASSGLCPPDPLSSSLLSRTSTPSRPSAAFAGKVLSTSAVAVDRSTLRTPSCPDEDEAASASRDGSLSRASSLLPGAGPLPPLGNGSLRVQISAEELRARIAAIESQFAERSSSSSSSISSTGSSLPHSSKASRPNGTAVQGGASPSSLQGAHGAQPQAGGFLAGLRAKITPRVKGLILLNILTFLYGTNVTVVKAAEAVLDPFSFSAGRFSIAAIAFLPFLGRALSNRSIRRAGMELGLWASLAYVTQAVGLITTDAGRAAFIGTFTVIEVPIIAGLFGAHIPPVTWWSAAAAVLGVGLLESSGSNSSFMGDFWTIVSALIFGVHMLRSEHHTRHVPQDGALPLIALQLMVTAVMSYGWLWGMSALGVMTDSPWDSILAQDWATVQSWPWLAMAYTGVLSTAFCLWVEVVSLRDVSAPEAAMVYTLEPLYGAGFAWVLLGERWGPLGWIGAALILGGSLTMQLYGQVESPTEEEDEEEKQQSSALVAALGAAAAIALIMVATGGVPVHATPEALEGSSGAVEVSGVVWAYGEAEVDNLVTLMRAYAMASGDEADKGDGPHPSPNVC